MKKYAIILLLSSLGFAASAQSFSKLRKRNGENPFTEDMFKLYARYTAVTSEFTPSYSGYTFNIGISDNDYDKGGVRIRYENPTLGDLIQGVPRAIKDAKAIVNDEQTGLTVNKWDDHSHGAGILGWLQYYINAVAKDKFIISPGISMGDYIYGSRYSKNEENKADHDPYGYYFVAGPALMGSYLLLSDCWIDAYINYDLAFYKVKNKGTEGYAKPHFLTVGADLHTSSKFFLGVRFNKLKDRGENNDASSRLDISAGLLF